MALRCFGWVVAHASVVMRWHGTGELGGPTGAIVLSPDVAGGVLPVDLWATQARCPQIHRLRDHNSKAIFHLVAPDPVVPYPPQIARSLFFSRSAKLAGWPFVPVLPGRHPDRDRSGCAGCGLGVCNRAVGGV